MTDPPEGEQLHAELLRRRIRESGLSEARFATDVLHRDPRTVRRWLSLESRIPSIVADFLENPHTSWPSPDEDPSSGWIDPLARGWMLNHIARAREALAESRIYLVRAWTEPGRVHRDLQKLPTELPEGVLDATIELQKRIHEKVQRRPPDVRGARAALLELEAVWK